MNSWSVMFVDMRAGATTRLDCLKGLGLRFVQTATGAMKRWVRDTIGLWPALEMRNRIVMGPRLPKLIRFENEEVARLQLQLGMTPTAKIACIIPTYKRPEGVAAAVHSILAQERHDFVIIVVDDGAGLPALPADPRLFAVSLSRNCGIACPIRSSLHFWTTTIAGGPGISQWPWKRSNGAWI
jgi:hypothetical protein